MFAKNYARHYELFHNDKPYKEEIDFVCKWARKPRSILDIGCGTAHYWEYFWKHDAFVIGVEKSKEMIASSKHGPRIDCLDAAGIGNFKRKITFDAATALFDVINYIPWHGWWKDVPLKNGGYFVFDIWDTEKVKADGFKKTVKTVGGLTRTIEPLTQDDKKVELLVNVFDGEISATEVHKMFLYSHKDIKKFCGNKFEIIETKATEGWQKWYKLRRK